MQLHRFAPGVAAQEPCLPRVLADKAEQYAQRRRLARAVGSQEAVHLTTLYREVQPVQRAGLAEGLDQARHQDGAVFVHGSFTSHPGQRAPVIAVYYTIHLFYIFVKNKNLYNY